jgi:hypothetical protein
MRPDDRCYCARLVAEDLQQALHDPEDTEPVENDAGDAEVPMKIEPPKKKPIAISTTPAMMSFIAFLNFCVDPNATVSTSAYDVD